MQILLLSLTQAWRAYLPIGTPVLVTSVLEGIFSSLWEAFHLLPVLEIQEVKGNLCIRTQTANINKYNKGLKHPILYPPKYQL